MNGIDLKLFRFDGDLTWMSFFMNAEDRFYTRYGGRSDTHAAVSYTHLTLPTKA